MGSGLGLSIVKRILDIHNFEITVKSEPDKGTIIFHIYSCEFPHITSAKFICLFNVILL